MQRFRFRFFSFAAIILAGSFVFYSFLGHEIRKVEVKDEKKKRLIHWTAETSKSVNAYVVEVARNGSDFIPLDTISAVKVCPGTFKYVVNVPKEKAVSAYRISAISIFGTRSTLNVIPLAAN